MKVWTRSHDKLIAEKCEGMEIRERAGLDESHRVFFQILNGVEVRACGFYNTDIFASTRALEAWVGSGKDRHAVIEIHGHRHHNVKLYEGYGKEQKDIWASSQYQTIPECIAWALHGAVSQ